MFIKILILAAPLFLSINVFAKNEILTKMLLEPLRSEKDIILNDLSGKLSKPKNFKTWMAMQRKMSEGDRAEYANLKQEFPAEFGLLESNGELEAIQELEEKQEELNDANLELAQERVELSTLMSQHSWPVEEEDKITKAISDKESTIAELKLTVERLKKLSRLDSLHKFFTKYKVSEPNETDMHILRKAQTVENAYEEVQSELMKICDEIGRSQDAQTTRNILEEHVAKLKVRDIHFHRTYAEMVSHLSKGFYSPAVAGEPLPSTAGQLSVEQIESGLWRSYIGKSVLLVAAGSIALFAGKLLPLLSLQNDQNASVLISVVRLLTGIYFVKELTHWGEFPTWARANRQQAILDGTYNSNMTVKSAEILLSKIFGADLSDHERTYRSWCAITLSERANIAPLPKSDATSTFLTPSEGSSNGE